MSTTTFMPSTDSGKADLLNHLTTALPPYATLLNISEDELAILNNDTFSFYKLSPQSLISYEEYN